MTRSRLRTSLLALLTSTIVVAAIAAVVASLPGRSDGDASRPAEATLVFAEFGSTTDRVYTAPAADPARRTLIAAVEHAEGWGIRAAPAMAGSLVAYTVLPVGSPGRYDALAELWLLDVATRVRTRLARDADLLVAPLFDADGAWLAYRSTGAQGEQRLVRVDLGTRARRVMHSYEGSFGTQPIGFTADGSLLFARLSNGGTDVFSVSDGEPAELLFHASDHIARDWRLSPDRASLSYVAPRLTAERYVHRLNIVAIGDGAERGALGGDSLAEQYAPVWTPSGAGVTVGREAYPALSAPAVTFSIADGSATALAAPRQGFDAPLGWSPDGRYLVARSFDGSGSYQPGRESMVVISTAGARETVVAATELTFLGWLSSG